MNVICWFCGVVVKGGGGAKKNYGFFAPLPFRPLAFLPSFTPGANEPGGERARGQKSWGGRMAKGQKSQTPAKKLERQLQIFNRITLGAQIFNFAPKFPRWEIHTTKICIYESFPACKIFQQAEFCRGMTLLSFTLVILIHASLVRMTASSNIHCVSEKKQSK